MNFSSNNSSEVYKPRNSSFPEIFVVDFRVLYRHGFEFALYGYFMPVWTLLNIVIYSLMVYVFIHRKLTSKTHKCLIALALSDSVAPIFPSIFWFYFFAVKQEFRYVPYRWCLPYHYLTDLLPNIFIHASYFLTIMLALQRYVVISHPFKAERLCSSKATIIFIIGCFVFSILVRFVHFFHYRYVSVDVPVTPDGNSYIKVCAFGDPSWLKITFDEYSAILQATHTIVVNIVPCIILIILEISLLKTVKTTSAGRKNIVMDNRIILRLERVEERLTYTTICVTGVLLMYKLPNVCIQAIDVTRKWLNIPMWSSYYDLWTAYAVLNVIYWICTPSNFIITCCLSKEFRQGLRHLFSSKKIKTNTITLVHTCSTSGSGHTGHQD